LQQGELLAKIGTEDERTLEMQDLQWRDDSEEPGSFVQRRPGSTCLDCCCTPFRVALAGRCSFIPDRNVFGYLGDTRTGLLVQNL